jgi:hypothetical protein
VLKSAASALPRRDRFECRAGLPRARGHGDIGASLGEGKRHPLAQALIAAGNQGNFAVDPEGVYNHWFSFYFPLER